MFNIRLCNVPDGESVIYLGFEYDVNVTENSIIMKRIGASINSVQNMVFGRKCQMFVVAMFNPEEISYPPVTVKDYTYQDKYTNVSGHIKTIEKYSK